MNFAVKPMDIHSDYTELFALFNLGRKDYIKNKKTIGRRKDAADIEALDKL
ncbi:hypothetical protein HY522_11345 [bacterium]|nr:hypothetical protein [bacterium]